MEHFTFCNESIVFQAKINNFNGNIFLKNIRIKTKPSDLDS